MSIDRSCREPRAQGTGDRDQPRRQGRQGRPAVLVHGARRDRRRGRPGRRRLREGARGSARDLEGGRRREEEPVLRAEARHDDHARDPRRVRRRQGVPPSGERGHRRHRRRRRASRARARRDPRRPGQEPRHDEPDQHGEGHGRRPQAAAPARGRRPRPRQDDQRGAARTPRRVPRTTRRAARLEAAATETCGRGSRRGAEPSGEEASA